MSQFKAGDLALVIAGLNAGRQVELLCFLGDAPLLDDPFNQEYEWVNEERDACWAVKGLSGPLNEQEEDSCESVLKEYVCEAEKDLMPLRGDFTPETEREEELTQ